MRHSPKPEPRHGMAGRRIALFAEAREWHTQRLVKAFKRRGADVAVLSLRDCSIETQRNHQIHLPGFADGWPDAAFVRTVPGGSFEAVTLRLGILHALAAEGVPIWNHPRAIERCVDKSTTSLLIARAGLPTPATWTVQGRSRAAEFVAREATAHTPLVLKPLFGAQGRGLRLIRTVDDLPEDDEVAGVYYLQRYVGVDECWRDYRCLVCQRRLLAAMVRYGTGWVTNIHQGGRAEVYIPPPEVASLAIRAAECVGAAYAGVDLIQSRDGEWFVLEVNSMPAWSGLQGVTPFDVSQQIVDELGATLRTRADAATIVRSLRIHE